MEQIKELLLQGYGAMGIVMAFSVAALAVAIERAIAQWKFVTRARSLGETVTRCLARGAVEAVVLFNFFSQRANRIATEMKLLTDEFLELLLDTPGETQPGRKLKRDDAERESRDYSDEGESGHPGHKATKRTKGGDDGD